MKSDVLVNVSKEPLDRKDACVISIEVDGRQRYLFETDKLAEMLGASRIIRDTVTQAKRLLREADGVHLFNPVSGEIRAWAPVEKRNALLDGVWELRRWLGERGVDHTTGYMEIDMRHFTAEAAAEPMEEPNPWELPSRPNLGWVHQAIGARVSALKGSKSSADARPTCSLFASCRLHGYDFANHWRGLNSDLREDRRNLRGYRAKSKEEAWNHEVKKQFFDEHLLEPVWRRALDLAPGVPAPKRPIAFGDLADQLEGQDTEGQYIAFLCADGDDIGHALTSINWNAPNWGPPHVAPWERSANFAEALDICVAEAFREAVVDVTVTGDIKKKLREVSLTEETPTVLIPCLPQLLGGDDLWTVARRDVALRLTCRFSETFQRLVADEHLGRYSVLRKALAVIPSADRPTLSMSVGIAFAKAGYPAHAMIEAAEHLLSSAKTLRKGMLWDRPMPRAVGCVDWHWIESSVSETVKIARSRGWSYEDVEEKAVLFLTTRPWTAKQCLELLDAAQLFRSIPRRKREQLEEILRLGRSLSLLAWTSWRKGLRSEERAVLDEVGACLEHSGLRLRPAEGEWVRQFTYEPWLERLEKVGDTTCHWTPLLDLLSLGDVLNESSEVSTAAVTTAEMA